MAGQIQFQICGLLLVSMILLLCTRQRSLNTISEKIFFHLLLAVEGSLVFDIFSVIALHKLPDTSSVKSFLCKTYLFFLIVICAIICYYILIDIHKYLSDIRWQFCICVLPLLLFAVLLFLLPISYETEADMRYTMGAAVYMTYLICGLYLVSGLYSAIRFRRIMSKSKRDAITFLVCCWILAAVIQYIERKWLVLGYALALSVVFIYVIMENPEHHIDRVTKCFNAEAMTLFIRERFSKRNPFSTISILFDDFKAVGDTFGRDNENRIMEMAAGFLLSLKGAKVFRCSEVEYTLTFANMDEMHKALELIEARFKNPWELFGMDINLSISMAYLTESSEVDSAEELLTTIQYFLNECKRRGKGVVIPINEEELLLKQELDHAEATLRWALEEEKIQVFYQPIFSLQDKAYTSAEALVRIFDEKHRFVSPEIFIPISEKNGLILELGMIVFEKVCRFMKEQSVLEKGIKYIEINLSVVQCMQDDLAEELLKVMQKYEIPPNAINLEITETAAVNSEKILLQNMEELIEQEVSFSLDDYGNGYSNLSYVVGLPLHIVKLDKSLVWSSFENSKANVAMESAISMIKSLGMKVLAEGVETKEQYARMESLQIDFIQGYLFSKPVCEEQFLQVIDAPIVCI